MLASASIVAARDQLVVCSLADLLGEYGFGPTSLTGLGTVFAALEHYDVHLDPSWDSCDDLLAARALEVKRSASTLVAQVRQMLASGGESYSVELKASISIDTKRKEHDPGKEIRCYRNDKLAWKLAQEICALMNRDGGTIYLGISNGLEIVGCEDDFAAYPGDGTPEDKADLIIKSIIEKYCEKPNSILSNMLIQCVEYEGRYVVVVEVRRMTQLAFIKKSAESKFELYMRIGTSAVPIPFCEIEDHFRLERKATI